MQTRSTRVGRFWIILLLSAAFLFQELKTPAQSFQIDLARDGMILGSGIVFAGLGELLVRFSRPVEAQEHPDITQVPLLDRAAMFPYSKEGDTVSTILEFASLSVPVVLCVSTQPDSTLSAAILYAESLALAYGTKNLLKFLFPRPRPYIYSGGAPGVDRSEDDLSFPSGHATMSFTAAAFSMFLFSRGLPGAANYLPLVAANFSLAGLTSSYRVLSGMHFITDVAAGAVIGVVCGFVVPSLVRQTRGRAL